MPLAEPNFPCQAPIHVLMESIQKRQYSARGLTRSFLDRIAELNPGLNAVVTLDAEGALETADELDRMAEKGTWKGPLHGIPMTLKDSIQTAGLRTTCGSRAWSGFLPSTDATLVSRLREAGAVILGKTNLPEGCRGFQTDNALFGRTNHPWNADLTPGGSSGGAAAAVSAGLSAADIGSDLGGSVRIPAHFCGLYALMATNHRISRMGHIPEWPGNIRALRTLGVMGPLARSLDDIDRLYRIIAGPDPAWPLMPPVPLDEGRSPAANDLKLRWVGGAPGIPLDPAYEMVFQTFLRRLQDEGISLEEGMPADWDWMLAWETFGGIRGAETTASLSRSETEEILEQSGMQEDLEVPMHRGHVRGALGDVRQYSQFLSERDGLIRCLDGLFSSCEALVLPVTAMPAFPHRKSTEPFLIKGVEVPYWMAGTGLTSPFNLTGHPVVVIPIGVTAENLPVGIQVVGPRWKEGHLMAVAKVLDALGPGFQCPR